MKVAVFKGFQSTIFANSEYFFNFSLSESDKLEIKLNLRRLY